MARIKLDELKKDIATYIGIPYFKNSKHLAADNVFVGKGTAQEIALKTIELANNENVKILELTSQQIYNFQKKHGLGIDCSGLACHLLNLYFGTNLDVRKTSANALTSPPLSSPISDSKIQTGDLIRQNNGQHVLFVIEENDGVVLYVHSGLKARGVHYGEFDIKNPSIKFDGIFRLNH